VAIDTSRLLDEYIERTGGHPGAGSTIWQFQVSLLRETIARAAVVLEARHIEPAVIMDVVRDLIYGLPSPVSAELSDALLTEAIEWRPATMTVSADQAGKLRGEFGLPPQQ
jgi:hypothetical protein